VVERPIGHRVAWVGEALPVSESSNNCPPGFTSDGKINSSI